MTNRKNVLAILTGMLTIACGISAVFAGSAAPVAALDPALRGAKYLDPSTPIEDRVDDLFGKLTLLEKMTLIHGLDYHGATVDMGDIPRIGLRKFFGIGSTNGLCGPPATQSPVAIAMASSWNPAAVGEMAGVMGEECLAVNSLVLLGPGMNILRTPMGGRTYEYMGEDPFLAGKIAAGFVRGIQSKGVSACIKHFTGNEQEFDRYDIITQLSERALREIYARQFEICIKESHPWALMGAYPQVNGKYCCLNPHLMIDILREDWGWDGQIQSDWGAWHDTGAAISAGSDLEMPGFNNPKHDLSQEALIDKGIMAEDRFNSAVKTNLRWLFRVGAFDAEPKKGSINTPAHQAVARKLADESIVLLKNNEALLPLNPGKLKTIAVIGPAADWKFSTGNMQNSGGSGAVNPFSEITALAGIRKRLGDQVKVVYSPGYTYTRKYGCDGFGKDPSVLVAGTDGIPKAAEAARNADVAIVCVGINFAYDHEVNDKPSMGLIGPATELIKAVVAANPKTIVVLTNGSPVLIEDWVDDVPALLEAWYPGSDGGNAIADVLFGDVNPSGKMPCTFGKKLTDWKSMDMGPAVYPGIKGVVKYDDGIWVGYRHFDHAGIEPRFPFGFGLSYTTFKLAQPSVQQDPDGNFTAQVNLTNTGQRDGAEVVELYMSPPQTTVEGNVQRPVRELAGFAKVFLTSGQTKTVSIPFSRDSLRYWSEKRNGWVVVPGTYTIAMGFSSRDLPVSASFDLK